MVSENDSPRMRRVHEWQASFDALLETLRSAGEDASVEILLNAPAGAFTGTEAMARTCEKLEELRDTAVQNSSQSINKCHKKYIARD